MIEIFNEKKIVVGKDYIIDYKHLNTESLYFKGEGTFLEFEDLSMRFKIKKIIDKSMLRMFFYDEKDRIFTVKRSDFYDSSERSPKTLHLYEITSQDVTSPDVTSPDSSPPDVTSPTTLIVIDIDSPNVDLNSVDEEKIWLQKKLIKLVCNAVFPLLYNIEESTLNIREYSKIKKENKFFVLPNYKLEQIEKYIHTSTKDTYSFVKDSGCNLYYYDIKNLTNLNNDHILYYNHNNVKTQISKVSRELYSKTKNSGKNNFTDEMRYVIAISGHGAACINLIKGQERRCSITSDFENNIPFCICSSDETLCSCLYMKDFAEELFKIYINNLKIKKKTVFNLYLFASCMAGSLLRNLILEFSILRQDCIDLKRCTQLSTDTINDVKNMNYCFIYGLTVANQQCQYMGILDDMHIFNKLLGEVSKTRKNNITLLMFFQKFIQETNRFTAEVKRDMYFHDDVENRISYDVGFYICYPYMYYKKTMNTDDQLYDYPSMLLTQEYVNKLEDIGNEIKKCKEDNIVKHTVYDIFGSLEPTSLNMNTVKSLVSGSGTRTRTKSKKKKSKKSKNIKKSKPKKKSKSKK
jgi:hypothetical protein